MSALLRAHDPSKCREKNKFDKDCCAMKSQASCGDGFKLEVSKHSCFLGIAYKYKCNAPSPKSYHKPTSLSTCPSRYTACPNCCDWNADCTCDSFCGIFMFGGGPPHGQCTVPRDTATEGGEEKDGLIGLLVIVIFILSVVLSIVCCIYVCKGCCVEGTQPRRHPNQYEMVQMVNAQPAAPPQPARIIPPQIAILQAVTMMVPSTQIPAPMVTVAAVPIASPIHCPAGD
jgi:hypothetical protein